MRTNTDDKTMVALDWGNQTHAYARHVAGSEQVESGLIEATPEALHDWLEQLHKQAAGPVTLAVEAGSNNLVYALLEHSWLTVYPIHPATSARFRKALVPSGAKDDLPDAGILLQLLRHHGERLKKLSLDTLQTRELAALVLARRKLVDQRTGLTNQLGGVLKGYFPQALQLAGEELAAPLALSFLRRYPELAVVMKAKAETLAAFYRKHHCRSEALIAKRLELVRGAKPLHQDRAVIETAKLEVSMLLEVLEVQARHIAKLEARIADCFAAHPKAELFKALPGAGPTLAPRLLVAFGDQPARYPNAASLQKYAGVAPVIEKSGKQSWPHWRWHASKFLRQSFVEWAGQTVMHCSWAHDYYIRQKQAGKSHQAILRALAFKWIRILWRCWHDQTAYDEQRYLAALHRHGSPLANPA